MKITYHKFLKRAILIMAPFVFLSSCEESITDPNLNDAFGLSEGTYTGLIEIPVITYTTDIDSILVALDYDDQLLLGGYASTRLLGKYSTNYFGEAEASIVGQLLPDQISPDFGTNPIVDSVNFYLRISDAYGDTSQSMDIQVYKLAESFSEDSIYFSSYNPETGELLGSIENYYPKPRKLIAFEDGSSLAYIKIPLDINYFQSNFADVGNGDFEAFSSYENFLEYFNGVKITTTSGGSILYTNLSSGYTGIRIHYHNSDQDTSYLELNFSQDRSLLPINFSTFDQNYGSANFTFDDQDTTNGEMQTYIQAMGGVATALKIDPTMVDSLLNEGLIINKAILELSTAMGTGDPAAPSNGMEIRILDKKGIGDRILDFQAGNGDGDIRLGALRNNRYVFDLSQHLFNTLNTGENPTLAVVPTSRTTAANRTIIGGGEEAGQAPKLVVYYTQP